MAKRGCTYMGPLGVSEHVQALVKAIFTRAREGQQYWGMASSLGRLWRWFQEHSMGLHSKDTCSRQLRIANSMQGQPYTQARKKRTKIKFLGPETARWGGGLPREGVVAENFVPALETLSSLGFEERNLGCPGNFAGMSRTPGGVQKVRAKKLRAHLSFPIHDVADSIGCTSGNGDLQERCRLVFPRSPCSVQPLSSMMIIIPFYLCVRAQIKLRGLDTFR